MVNQIDMSLFPSLSPNYQQVTPQQTVSMPSQPQLTQSTPQTMVLNSSTTQLTSSRSYKINWKTDSYSQPQQPTPVVSNPSIECCYYLIIRSSYGNSNCNGND